MVTEVRRRDDGGVAVDGESRSTTASIWALLPSGQLDAAAGEVMEALRSRGAVVTGPTPELPPGPVDAVLVLLPPDGQDVPGADDLERRLAPWRGRLLPVVPGTRSSPVFEDLSQLLLGSGSTSRAVERILLVARVGGSALADLYRLMGSVQQWERAGRPESLLLRGSQVDEALLLLASASASGMTVGAATDYVAASGARRRRRTRRAAAIAAVSAVVLVAASVTAFLLSGTARTATAASLEEQAHADSVRLAGLAAEAVPLDPDLPWLLAAEALAHERSTEALVAARQVLASSPAHRSIRLPAPAMDLASDLDSGTMALLYPDGGVEMRSGADGELLTELAAGGQPHHFVSLGPGGELLLLGGEDDDSFVSADDGTIVATLAPDQSFWGWSDARHAVISTGGSVGLLDVASGTVAPTTASVAAERLGRRAWAERPGGGWAYLLDGESLIALDLTTGQTLPSMLVPGATDVAASPDGRQAFVTVADGSAQVFRRGADGLAAEEAAGAGENVSALAEGWLLTDSAGQAALVTTGQAAPMSRFSAHRGPVTGAGPIPDGGFATAGGDRYLRLWPRETRVAGLPSPDVQPSVLAQGQPNAYLESSRPLIAHEPESDRLTYLLPGAVGVVDARTLERIGDDSYVNDLGARSRPLPDGRIALIGDLGTTGVYDVATGEPVWTRALDRRFSTLTSLMSASPVGDRLAVASPTELVAWGPGDDPPVTVQFAVLETPVAVLLDAEQQASVLTASGTWYREGQETLVVTAEGETATAAAWGPEEVLHVLTDDGSLLSIEEGRTRVIATVPDGLAGFALRSSADGRYIGVIGMERSVVVSSRTGRVAADLPSTVFAASAVRDVAMDGDVLWSIRADGALTRQDILDDEAVLERLAELRPRALTDGERDVLGGATGFPGGD